MARLRLRARDSREARAVLAGAASAAVASAAIASEAAASASRPGAGETTAVTPGVPPDPSAAAFFDVDNTIMVGASIFHFAKGLAARRFFTWRDLVSFAYQQVRFRVGGKETGSGMLMAQQAALAFVAGKRVDDIVALCEEIYDELMAERIWRGTLALARKHAADGQRVWLVTATPVELAQIIARRLELTGALGTVAEVHDGVYTGRLVGEPLHGEAKAAAVLALAATEGLDLDRCSAYSDSVNDLPMLTTVGHPVAINPDSALRLVARSRGWDVRDFRTGRKAAKVGVPTALGMGAVAGGIATGLAVRRRYRLRSGERRLPYPTPLAGRPAARIPLVARLANIGFASVKFANIRFADRQSMIHRSADRTPLDQMS